MCIARGDTTPLPGIDQDAYVTGAAFDRRNLSDLAVELAHLRRANLALFRSLGEEEWGRQGTSDRGSFTVRVFPFVIAGHERHHRGILRERYL
jgi:hypothetical protein